VLRLKLGLALLLACGLIAVSGCGQKSEAAPAPVAPPPTSVTAAMVETRDVAVYLSEIGRIVSPETVSIQPQVAGRITGVHFTEGKDVKKGDPLFTIDPRPFQAALDQSKAELAVNQAAMEETRATLQKYHASIAQAKAGLEESVSKQKLNQIEFERAKNLMETNAVSRQEFDSRQVALTTGEAQINSAKAEIAQAEAQLKQGEAAVVAAEARVAASRAAIAVDELNLEYTSIHAPIDARAGQRLVDLGNVVTANTNASPLVMLQSMDPIYAEFTVPEAELPRVRESLQAKTLVAECSTPDHQDTVRAGEVFFIDNSVQQNTGTLKLRARIPNSDRFFWPGQYVNVRLVLGTDKEAKLVPASALQVGQAGQFVFVVKEDSTVEMRPIKSGLRYDDLMAVNEGLKSGESVVVRGQLTLYPGAKVVVTNPKGDEGKTADKGGAAK
jgi:membrane fusion protein, multidrug efflux system